MLSADQAVKFSELTHLAGCRAKTSNRVVLRLYS